MEDKRLDKINAYLREPVARIWALCIVVILILALTGVTLALHHTETMAQSKLAAQQTLQREQLVQGCVRLNVLRVSDNRSHYADYRYAWQQYHFAKRTLKADYLALRKLGVSRKLLRQSLKHSEDSLRTQRSVIKAKSWTPLTNCATVVAQQGVYYETPGAIPFSKRRPSELDLNTANAERLDPVGSVN